MVGRTKQPTRRERQRIDAMMQIGCVCCRRELGVAQPAECHHIVEGYRLGHWFTIPLCPWHHRGKPVRSNERETRETFGPSLALHKRDFIARYGSERELHDQVNTILKRRGQLP